MDDANNVRLLFHVIPQWPGTLLGSFEYHQNRYAVLHRRVGWTGDRIQAEANGSRPESPETPSTGGEETKNRKIG